MTTMNKVSHFTCDVCEATEKLNIAIHQFCKRQMTFFRNMEKNGIIINWIPKGDINQILDLITNS